MSYRDSWDGDAEEAQAQASFEAEAAYCAGLESQHAAQQQAEYEEAMAAEENYYWAIKSGLRVEQHRKPA